ncbi:MAG: Omp28-related outer membrane protein [Bacteroidales bacterium]|nr:Omp28-related outer membrane protein [Bacteroidales bacterium]
MKKIILSAFALLAIAACQSEMAETPVNAPEIQTVIHAVCSEVDPATRTVRQEDGKVFWSPDEEISVFQGHMTYGGQKFTSTNTGESATADFVGSLPASSGYYWALYPYNADSWCYNGNYIVTYFSNEQKGKAGSFPDDLYIALARSETTDMVFKHPLGGIKFSVVSSGIKRITLKANGGEAIYGYELALDFDSNGNAFVGEAWDTSDHIFLEPEDGGTFVPGAAYYFVTIPCTMASGFKLIMERNDGTVLTRNVDKSVTVPRATFRTLMEADKGLSWSKPELSYSPDAATVSALGGTLAITVTTMGSYHVDVADGDWLTPDGTDGDPMFGCKHFFKVAPNTGAERMGVITVCDDTNCYPVIITQRDGTNMKTIAHHSLGMRFTATWCGYCPNMNEGFALAKANLGDKFEILNLHGSGSGLAFPAGYPLSNVYQITGFPTGIVDGRMKIGNYNSSYIAYYVAQAIEETESNYPVMTSMGISSSLSGSTLNASVSVYVREPGDYKLTVLLMEDGIVYTQSDYVNGTQSNYVHDNIARALVSNSILGDEFTVTAGDRTEQFNYSIAVPSVCNLEKLHILAYVQKPFGAQKPVQSGNYGDWYIDNCRAAAVGIKVDPEVSD